MSEDWQPRPSDALVEPFFAILDVDGDAAGGGERRVRVRELVAVAVGAFVLALVWLWPLPLHAGDHLPHDPRFQFAFSDVHLGPWGLWWAREAVATAENPFYCHDIFHPHGHSLAFHTHGMLWGIVSAPLQWLGGAVFAANAMLFLLLAASAAATWALARELGASRGASAVAAFAWAFSPYFLQKGFHHLCYFASPWPPLALFFLVRWMRSDTSRAALRAAVATGVVLALCMWTSTMITLYTLITAAFVVLLAPGPRRGLARPLPWLAGVGLSLLIAVPFLVEFRRELHTLDDAVARDQPYRPHLVDFFSAFDHQPLLGELRDRPADAPYDANEARSERLGMELGWSFAGLLGLAAVFAPRSRRWIAIGVPAFLLAWDPGGAEQGILSGWVKELPLLSGIRFPARAWPLALLPWSVAAALGVDALLRRPFGRYAAAALVLFLPFERWIGGYPSEPVFVPEAVEALAELPGDGAVVSLPWYDMDRLPMTWQSIHGRPVLLSYVARTNPKAAGRVLQTHPLLSILLLSPSHGVRDESTGALLGIQDGPTFRPLPAPEELGRELEETRVDGVLLRGDLIRNERAIGQLADLFDAMPGWTRHDTGDGVHLWTSPRAR